MKKNFTLAEVLITLGIIGVVAALTIPSLIEKYNEKIFLKRFQQTRSILTQATKLVTEEYGDPISFTFTDDNECSEKLYSYYTRFLKTNLHTEKFNKEHIFADNYKFLDGKKDGNIIYWHGKEQNIMLANGVSLAFKCNNSANSIKSQDTFVILIDLNGTAPPNTLGKDAFFLTIRNVKGETVIAGYNQSFSTNKYSCNTELNSNNWQSGLSCTSWIIKYNNMDYLHRETTTSEWNKVFINKL